MKSTITIFGRPGCHLCDEAWERVSELTAGSGVEIEKVDIEGDDELHRRFFEKIPVVEVDGRQVAELGQYRRPAFAKALEEALSK